MSRFIWRDGDGQEHRLDSPALIETEYAAIGKQLATYAVDLESCDATIWEAALDATEPLAERHNVLLADLRRWNDHAAADNKDAAAKTVSAIEGLIADAALIQRLHAHFVAYENGSTTHHTSGVAKLEDQPANERLVALVTDMATRHGVPVPPVTTTAGAHAWLCARPESNRTPLPLSQPTFAWANKHGHMLQIRSLIDIEREQVSLIGELAGLRPKLVTPPDAESCAKALEQGRGVQERLIVLQLDCERFAAHVLAARRRGALNRAKEIRKFTSSLGCSFHRSGVGLATSPCSNAK